MQNERMRVIKQVKKNEKVLDMFAGVGPFAIPIAKKAHVCAIDINPYAIRYLKENARINKVELRIFEGDCKKIIKNLGEFDRIIMNFPKGSKNFLDIALKHLKKKGIIHFYTFEKKDELNKKNIVIRGKYFCGDVAPGLSRVCYDLVKK